jgi:hypothetical protein
MRYSKAPFRIVVPRINLQVIASKRLKAMDKVTENYMQNAHV